MSIEVSQLTRFFGQAPAVHQLDMSVPSGAVTGLVGPNGAGKTTLLLMLAALLAPDHGTIRVAGLDPVTQPREVHRAVGWMPDAFGTWDSLTCTEILTTFATAQGLDRAAGRRNADEMLAAVHLDEMARTPARVLSRGQKQRLGLARALVHRPQVLLLDEPAAGMDPRSRADLRVLLREAGSVVERDELMREVWGSDPTGSTKTLDMHVSWLRRKLGDEASDPHYITTVRGMGFRFETTRR